MKHIPIIDIPLENMILSKEDLKITDNIKSRKKEQINRNYDLLFSEEKSIKVHQLIDKYYSQLITQGMGIKSFATFLRLRFIEKVKRFYIEEDIWEKINFLTCNIMKEAHEQVLENLKMNRLVKEVKENNGSIGIKTTFGEIKFSEIERFFPDLDVDDDIKRDSRTGECHRRAIEFSKKLKNMGIENDVVTANRCITADKTKYLHSWIEFKINGQELILDYTQNVVMNKEGYYALNHIDKIISIINCADIINDEKLYKQIDNGNYYIDLKTYLTCRDEIMRDLQKNIDIFNEER